jgi:putative glutamine amidotransferase
MSAPIIGVTANLRRDEQGRFRHEVKNTYLSAIVRAGGVPLILPAIAAQRESLLHFVDGVLLTGGDDIDTRPFGAPLHAQAQIMEPDRQEAEFALLRALDARREIPTLGICLGMQLMGVHGGCGLLQHLHDHFENGDRHRFDNVHDVKSELGAGPVASWHHQALESEGPFDAIGWSDDGILEAIRDPSREFYVGVQWHPERTKDAKMGDGIVSMFVAAARAHRANKERAARGRRGVR